MPVSVFARTLFAFVLFALLANSAAFAQDGATQPPTYPTYDDRGVDLSDVIFNSASPTITIGDPASGGLSYNQALYGNGWSHSIMGTVHAASATEYRVTLFGGTEVFIKSGSTFTPEQENGATLTLSSGIYTYTTADGTVATFNASLVGASVFYGGKDGVLTQVTFPNNEEWTYTYTSTNMVVQKGGWPEPIIVTYGPYYRLQSVNTNRGYQLHFEYVRASNVSSTSQLMDWRTVETATLINNAVDYCSPTANTCSGLTENWPSLTMSYTSSAWTYTDNLGRTTSTLRDGSGRVTGVRYPGSTSNDISVNYVGTSLVVQSMTVHGSTWVYGYSSSGGTTTTTLTDPAGSTTDFEFDSTDGFLRAVENALGHRTTYTYNTDNRIERIEQPEGNATEFSYDARGNITQRRQIAKPGSGLSNLVTSWTYVSACDSYNFRFCNSPLTMTDAAGQVTNFDYDSAHGGVTKIISPAPSPGADRPEQRIAYSRLYARYKVTSNLITQSPTYIDVATEFRACASGSQPSCQNNSSSTRTNLGFGSFSGANNLIPVTVTTQSGDGSLVSVTSFTHDAIGNLLTVDGPLAGSADLSRIRYDDLRRVVGEVGPDPDGAGGLAHSASRTTYDTAGRVTQVQFGTVSDQSDSAWNNFVGLEYQTVQYDNNHRVTHSRLLSSGGVTQALIQYSYDTAGRLDCAAQRMNPNTFGSPPSSACTLGTQGVFGPDRISKNQYDALSRVTGVTTAYGTTVATLEASSTFTNNGQLDTLADGAGNLTRYVRDGFDRQSQIQYAQASNGGSINASDYQQWSYAANGRVNQYRSRSGALVAYTYDNLGRVTFADAPGTAEDATTVYDNLGRVTSRTENGYTTTNAYDGLGRMTSQTGNLGQISYQYDIAGRRTRMTWQDGFYVTYSHNTRGQITAIRENGVGSGIGVLAEYTYDQHGRRTYMARGNGVNTDYNHDAAGRLQQLVQDVGGGTTHDLDVSFTYNPAGQITQRSASNIAYSWSDHINADVIAAFNGLNQFTSITGQATPTYDSRGNMTSDGTRTFGYDNRNRLTSVSGGVTINYDPMGRLYNLVTPTQNRRFQYDGFDLIAEYNGSGGMEMRYVHGPGVDEPIVQYTGSGTGSREWLIADERGSIIAHTNSSGVATQINTYDEYGLPGSSNDGRFGYTGQVWLEETGLYHYKARAYSPTLGRFLQTDPIGQAGGLNIYAYVGGDPVNFVDPLGLTEDSIKVTCPTDGYCGGSGGGGRPSGFGGGFSGGAAGIGRGPDVITVTATSGTVAEPTRSFGNLIPGEQLIGTGRCCFVTIEAAVKYFQEATNALSEEYYPGRSSQFVPELGASIDVIIISPFGPRSAYSVSDFFIGVKSGSNEGHVDIAISSLTTVAIVHTHWTNTSPSRGQLGDTGAMRNLRRSLRRIGSPSADVFHGYVVSRTAVRRYGD